jgi:hypothetical protein
MTVYLFFFLRGLGPLARSFSSGGLRALRVPGESVGPSMRRPVGVKRYCGWVSSYLMFSFARISDDLWLSAAAVKAERSEFILSLDSRRGQP